MVESGGYLVLADLRPDGGLRADEARDLADRVGRTPPCGRSCAVVVGPLDDTTPRAGDALLKATEELRGGCSVFAWALDLASVPAALRSRSLATYVPGPDGPPPEVEDLARRALDAAKDRPWEVGPLLANADVRDLLLGVAEAATYGDPEALRAWGRARRALQVHRPSRTELLWVFVGGPR